MPFGVICEGLVEQKRIYKQDTPTNYSPSTVKFGRSVFLVCPLGKDRQECSIELKKLIENINHENQAKPDYQPLSLNESELEISNHQARICFNDDYGNLDFLIWPKFDKKNTIVSANILPLSDVLYDERSYVITRIKKQQEGMVTTLSWLKDVPTQKWNIAENHDFDHFVGSGDSKSLGIIYGKASTQCVPQQFNRKRPMDPINPDAQDFKTTIAEDTVGEVERLCDPFNPEDLYENSANSANLPDRSISNIRIQQESAMRLGFLQSVDLLEEKAAHLKVDVTSLKLTDQQIENFGVERVTHEGGKTSDIFNTQKLWKSYRNCNIQLDDFTEQLESNYKLSENLELNTTQQASTNTTQQASTLNEVLEHCTEHFLTVTKLAEIECNLLGLSRNNIETQCALETIQFNVSKTQGKLIDSMVQFHRYNGNPNVTREEVEETLKLRWENTVDNCIIHDNVSFETNMNDARNTIQRYNLDKNKVQPNTSLFSKDSPLESHYSDWTRNETEKLKIKKTGLTPHVVEPKIKKKIKESPYLL